MKIKPDTLPDKPSDLLELALYDLAKVERSRKYEVAMSGWHNLDQQRDVCQVCLAGAVMAKSLHFKRTQTSWENLSGTTVKKFFTLDMLRTGKVANAIREMNLSPADWGREFSHYRLIPSYDSDPAGFREALDKLVLDLREKGY